LYSRAAQSALVFEPNFQFDVMSFVHPARDAK
jgi:hypothetical protein